MRSNGASYPKKDGIVFQSLNKPSIGFITNFRNTFLSSKLCLPIILALPQSVLVHLTMKPMEEDNVEDEAGAMVEAMDVDMVVVETEEEEEDAYEVIFRTLWLVPTVLLDLPHNQAK